MGNILGELEGPTDSEKAFKNFERLYNRQHQEMDPNDAANVAIRLWGTLTPREKQLYENLDWNIYDEAIVPNLKRTPKLKSRRKKSSPAARKILKKKSPRLPRKKVGKPKPRVFPRTRPEARGRPRGQAKAATAKAKCGNSSKARARQLEARRKASRKEKERANNTAFVSFVKQIREATCLTNKQERKDSLRKAAQAYCNLKESQRRKFYNMAKSN